MSVFVSFLVNTKILRMFNGPVFKIFKSYIDSRIDLISGYVADDSSIEWISFRILIHDVLSGTGSSDKITWLFIKKGSQKRFPRMTNWIINPYNRSGVSRTF